MDTEDALFTKLRASRATFESDPGQTWFTSGWVIRSMWHSSWQRPELGEGAFRMKWQASRRDSSQPVTGKQNHPLPAAGTSGPLCYLDRPQGGVSAEALPEREGQLAVPGRPLASQNGDGLVGGQRAGQTEGQKTQQMEHLGCEPWAFSLRFFPFFHRFETFYSKILGGKTQAPCRPVSPGSNTTRACGMEKFPWSLIITSAV